MFTASPEMGAPRRVGNRWVFDDGTTLPVVSGGDGPDDTPDDDTPDDDTPDGDDDVAKWKSMSRKNEREAKKLRRELAEARKKGMSDDERAIEEAKEVARAETRAELSGERVAAAFERALAGTDVDVDELVDGINVAKFLDDDGKVDRDAVASFVKKLGVTASGSKRKAVDMGQGARTPAPAKGQLTRADIARMTPEEIVEADKAGRFADLKAGKQK